MPSTTPIEPAVDTDLLRTATVLRERAVSLRAQAELLPDLLAATYRRRASELELEAWVAELQSGVPVDQVRPAA